MTVVHYSLAVLAGLVAGLFVCLIKTNRNLYYLRTKYDDLNKRQNDMTKEYVISHNQTLDELNSINQRIEKHEKYQDYHGTLHDVICESLKQHSDELLDIKTNLKAIVEGLNEAHRRITNIQSLAYGAAADAIRSTEQELLPDLDIVDGEYPPEDREIEWKDSIPTYTWMFNASGDPGDIPNVGEVAPMLLTVYMVIGVLAGYDTETCSEATWEGITFMDNDRKRFKKVYAYIRMPSPCDVMEKIFDCSLTGRDSDGRKTPA